MGLNNPLHVCNTIKDIYMMYLPVFIKFLLYISTNKCPPLHMDRLSISLSSACYPNSKENLMNFHIHIYLHPIVPLKASTQFPGDLNFVSVLSHSLHIWLLNDKNKTLHHIFQSILASFLRSQMKRDFKNLKYTNLFPFSILA